GRRARRHSRPLRDRDLRHQCDFGFPTMRLQLMPHFQIPIAPVAWLAQRTRLDLLPSAIMLGWIATGAFAQDQDCESRLSGSPAAMVEQKSAPDLVYPAPDKKFLPSDFGARVSLEADRARSTRDGERTTINAKELVDSEFTAFDPDYAAHRR